MLAISFQIWRFGWSGAADAVDGDLGYIASYAAGLDHAELFAGDPMLGDARNFAWYSSVHVPLARAAHKLAGSYAGVFLATYGLHIFAHLAGFYLLGVVLFGSPFWATVLALIGAGAGVGGNRV